MVPTAGSGDHWVLYGALMACMLGFFAAIAPDHLCILINMTVGMGPSWKAAKVAISWGFGHNLGLAFVASMSMIAQSQASLPSWLSLGDYLAGVILVAVGSFFLICEKWYLEQDEEGNYSCLPCCGGHSVPANTIKAGKQHDCGDCEKHVCEEQPLLKGPRPAPRERSRWYDVKGFLIGVFQGVCCPSCLISIGFAGKVGDMQPSILQALSFLAALMISTSFFSVIAVISILSLAKYFGSNLAHTAPVLYRTSCIITLMLGIVWIALAFTGNLDILEMHDHSSMTGNQHSSHDLPAHHH